MSITIIPLLEEFRELAKLGNVIPVYADLVCDGETPTSGFQKLAGEGHSFLFESAEQTEQSGRFSFIGCDPRIVLSSDAGSVSIQENGETKIFFATADPLGELERVMKRFSFVPRAELPRFAGGAVGFLGYDIARYFEPTVPRPPTDDLHLPEMVFMIMGMLVIFDHRYRRVQLVANAFIDAGQSVDDAYAAAVSAIVATLEKLSAPTQLIPIDTRRRAEPRGDVRSNTTREEFVAAVQTAQEFIAAGDIFQVVLSQRFETDFRGDALQLYRCLRMVNPSPYMFCLRFGDLFSLVGSSPEMHARVTDGHVEVRPIAGTRRRGATPEKDAENAAELLADPKERAEHVMLIDLARSDVGRIAEVGSVHVIEQMTVERYSHVMHLGSHVTARLRKDKSAYDVMRATFPAGTVSGAPKIRAMKIISELEKTKRGCYAGAVGYFGFDGALDCCIALRSVVLKGGRAFIQAGAGIVADSIPEAEYRETVSKAMAMIEAIGRAEEINDPVHR